MELIICFALAVSAFVTLIALIVGLICAPTPILVGILVTGMLLTQKSISKFTQETINVMEEKDKTKIEKVNVVSNTPKDAQKIASMTYRGYNYQRLPNTDKPSVKKNEVIYRGAKISSTRKEIV